MPVRSGTSFAFPDSMAAKGVSGIDQPSTTGEKRSIRGDPDDGRKSSAGTFRSSSRELIFFDLRKSWPSFSASESDFIREISEVPLSATAARNKPLAIGL